jgi:hypothetical protein
MIDPINSSKAMFPFGNVLQAVKQTDCSPKKMFILGVYASAVHARWIGADGKQKVNAFAVASEPYIFWRGDGAKEIIERIKIPPEIGYLTEPSVKGLNGPSGRALDELYLRPLGIDRSETWLCDLLPESRVNPQQEKAIEKHYLPFALQQKLPPSTIPQFNAAELDSEKRRVEILNELKKSQADTLILLGDLPIKWFLKYYVDSKPAKLSQFGTTQDSYGRMHEMIVAGRTMNVLPLCHPRQAGKLGTASSQWGLLHEAWIRRSGKS